MEEVYMEIPQVEPQATAPQPGSRQVVITNITPIYNNVGVKKVFIQYAYTKAGKTFNWGLTYDATDRKLAKIFPCGKITSAFIGKPMFVEIGYCNSKNGEYPSVLGLSDDVQ